MRAISVEDLQPGMVLARTLTNEDMVVVLSAGTVITKAHITRLTFLDIPLVYIKDDDDLKKSYLSPSVPQQRANAFTQAYENVARTAENVFNAIRQGDFPKDQAKSLVDGSLAPLSKNSGAIDYLYDLNRLSPDISGHSLRVAILSGVMAKWMHFDAEKTRDLMMAGFLHDIGKIKFDQRLLGKNVDRLQGDDLEAYIQHTVDGYHILNTAQGVSEGVKLAAMQHHERMDGSGFPFNCMGPDIHEYARVIAVADIYDNMTAERQGYVKQTPFAAIAYITEHLYTTLDPVVCVPMLTHIKDAFLGSRVTLSNGDSGTIASYPNDFAANPIVHTAAVGLLNLNDHPDIAIVEYNPK